MKILARTGVKGEPMTSPSISLYNLLLKIKLVCDVATKKKCLSSFLVIFKLRLLLMWNIGEKASYIGGDKIFRKDLLSWSLKTKERVSLQK